EFNPGEIILNQTQMDENIPKRGYIVVKLDTFGVAQKVRLQEGKTPLNDGEYLIVYTRTKWDLNIGAESYFFQEGEADKFAEAKYGGLKIDTKGNNVLEGLYDENRKRIE
ncbi:MAG: GDYXXLXY domain-containing protein, partial [Cytophaga sp.]|uniref:GDYXXLXY domain-containing protein n=1 Tax=Cytophaga sp. TaxID=29535 RepID=UPI003F81C262